MSLVLLFASALGQAQDLSSRLDRYFTSRAEGPFNGVVLVAREGHVLFERGYGLADADLGVRNAPAMRFGIGSLTKPITAAAVMKLVERGSLKLSDPVCSFLQRCPNSWRTVTIRHLLSHTSGIPDLFGELPAAPVDSTRRVVDAAIARHLGDSLRSPPGERHEYSNFNYFLLGYAMEVVEGVPWESVLRREIFGPLGMHETAYDDVWRIMPGRVRGYAMVAGELRHINYHDHSAYAAGGLLSTLRDLLAFDVALSSARIVSDSTYRVMTTPVLGDYGLGWQMATVVGRHVRHHTGGTNGFSSYLGHYDDGTAIIILRNVEGAAAAKATGCDVAAIVFGQVSIRTARQGACRPVP
ncbi:MAG TPA: serine hydrolase domain-containing protein [Gemmatimonadaceae bacterium]|nr:serine hydrolase domain-containing protein [Gemmatimonadaceae bacterium]